MLLGLGRIWVLSGKRKADVARPNGRPFDRILAGRLTSANACLQCCTGAGRAIKARDKGGTGDVGLIKRSSPDRSVTGGE